MKDRFPHRGLVILALVLLAGGFAGAGDLFAQAESTPGEASADTAGAAATADSTGGSARRTRPDEPTLEELLRPTISPTKAVLMTPVWPGWGQLYAKNNWRAALAFGLEAFYMSNLLMNDRKAVRISDIGEQLPEGDPRKDLFAAAANEYWERMRDFGWWYLGGMLIIAVDAYVGAHLYEFDEDRLPVPNRWPGDLASAPSSLIDPVAAPTVVLFQWRLRF